MKLIKICVTFAEYPVIKLNSRLIRQNQMRQTETGDGEGGEEKDEKKTEKSGCWKPPCTQARLRDTWQSFRDGFANRAITESFPK